MLKKLCPVVRGYVYGRHGFARGLEPRNWPWGWPAPLPCKLQRSAGSFSREPIWLQSNNVYKSSPAPATKRDFYTPPRPGGRESDGAPLIYDNDVGMSSYYQQSFTRVNNEMCTKQPNIFVYDRSNHMHVYDDKGLSCNRKHIQRKEAKTNLLLRQIKY